MSRKQKTLHVLLLVGAVLLGASPQVARANLVDNGGFENGLNNWTFTGDGVNDVASISSDTPTGIGSSADLNITQGNGLPWLIQDVPVTVGANLIFAASVREIVPNSPADGWIAAQVWMLPSSGSGTILTSGAAFFSSPSWEEKNFNITVPAGATIARILFTPQNPSFGVGTGQYRIDDVSLVVPEPASMVLWGSGGLAALWHRRSRRQAVI